MTIVISSGEDSDVEFLGYGASNNTQRNCDGAYRRREDAATKEFTVQPESMIRKVETKLTVSLKNGRREYICKRCHKPGKHSLVVADRQRKRWRLVMLIINRPPSD